MKQVLAIVLLSIISVGIGYVIRSETREFEVQTASLETIQIPDVPRFDLLREVEPQKPTNQTTLTLSSNTLEQGDTLVVSIEHENKVELQIQNKKIPLISVGSKKSIAIYGIDVRKEPGALSISLFENNSLVQEKSVKITKRSFPVTELVLSESQKEAGVTPEKAARDIVEDDNAKLYEVLDAPLPDIYIKNEFAYPLPANIIVGGFGNIRKSGETEIRHLGVDLDAKRGDPVKAIQDGVVRLTRNLSNYGNTIVVDHGANIFSMYLHLNSMQAKEGESVSKGQIIGSVGNTGDYSLDPHLHLSIKANGASVDPLRFIETIAKTIEVQPR